MTWLLKNKPEAIPAPSSRKESADVPWHAMSGAEVLEKLAVNDKGLNSEEVLRHQEHYGPNLLPEGRRHGPLLRFLLQFHNVLIYVLLGAAAVTALLAHWVDTGVIVGVVLINALIGFVQEGKAEDALRALRQMLSPQAMVLRDGQRVTIAAEELVPGDIVFLQSGDKVPADLRLLSSKNLQIQESMLTGESVAVEKGSEPVAADTVLGDRAGMAYSSTLVTYGQGIGVVAATGARTEIGQISAMLEEVETLTTPLLRQMAQFSRWLTVAIIAIAAGTFVFGVLVRDYTFADMFIAAVGLAVAAIPEGLPAIMTITMAIGVQRMARRQAIIRRLPAVETLGSVTVICSDKTGTLTRNEMTVQSVVTGSHAFKVTGVGYDPHGAFSYRDSEVQLADYPVLTELVRGGLLCNDTRLQEQDGQWTLHGNPTEGALITLAIKAGLDPHFERENWPRTDIIPFESQHAFMASLQHDHAGHAFTYVKGAPERVLEMCDKQRIQGGDQPLDHEYWHLQMNRMARRGQRVLAIAFREVDNACQQLEFAQVQTGLTLLGLVGMIDPPRADAIRAVQQCRNAGIRVKMITGDHAVTAVAIARHMGIDDGDQALTGHDLESLDEEQLRAVVNEINVFARSSPEHKLRLVKALQANGHVVAMTGDGVNDAPALKRADVGSAMGQKGTEVAKDASEMVLADDNFASIAHAVEEGRTVYDNLKKAILFILPTNGGEALIIIAAIALGRTLPITPVQILWVNMITAVTLALALAFEPPEGSVMQHPPRNSREPLLTPYFIWRIVFVSLILVTGTFGLFIWERNLGASIELARTIAVNTLVMFEIFYLFNSRYITAPVLNRMGLLGNGYALIAVVLLIAFQLAFTYLDPMQTLFGTASIDAVTWLRIILVASSVLFLVEIEKAFVRRLG